MHFTATRNTYNLAPSAYLLLRMLYTEFAIILRARARKLTHTHTLVHTKDGGVKKHDTETGLT